MPSDGDLQEMNAPGALALGWAPDFRWFNSVTTLAGATFNAGGCSLSVVPKAGAAVTIFVIMKQSLSESRNHHREKALLRDVGKTGPRGGVWGPIDLKSEAIPTSRLHKPTNSF